MNTVHLVIKTKDGDIEHKVGNLYENVIMFSSEDNDKKDRSLPYNVENEKNKLLSGTFLGRVLKDDFGQVKPLSQLFDYELNEDIEGFKAGTPFSVLLESDKGVNILTNSALKMFNKFNPMTHRVDVDEHSPYARYIPLVVMSGIIPVQNDSNGESYFNPDGVVSVAQFLDCLNGIKYGFNANNRRKKTLDNISDEKDFFNEGYQDCLRGISSPFFNLYTRKELMQPITRLELAYITVICWKGFIEKFNNLYNGTYYLGVNIDWENPYNHLKLFKDGFDYKVSRVTIENGDDSKVTSLNIKDYKGDKCMEEYKVAVRSGSVPIPLPMFMSLLELNALDLFRFEGDKLSPMSEVSRGELSYFVTKLAKEFPMKYIKNKNER